MATAFTGLNGKAVDVIILGDCLEVMKQFDSNSIVGAIITSPPYPGNKEWGDLYKPEKFEEAHNYLNRVWDECLRILAPGCKLIINIANTGRRPYRPNTYKIYQWAENKCEPLGEIIWYKGYAQIGTAWGSYCNPSDPALADQHEYILVFRKYGKRANKQRGYFIEPKDFTSWRNSVWLISPERASKIGHPTPFPLEIPKRLIQLYTYPGEIVLDPFCGSGTTCLAARQLKRKYIGIEINPQYYELAIQRMNCMFIQEKLDIGDFSMRK